MQNEARKFSDMSGEKQINCATGNTFFHFNPLVNVLNVEIYILNQY